MASSMTTKGASSYSRSADGGSSGRSPELDPNETWTRKNGGLRTPNSAVLSTASTEVGACPREQETIQGYVEEISKVAATLESKGDDG